MNNWVKVFSSSDLQEASLMKLFLQNYGIDVFLNDRKDSVYPTFGEVELSVAPEDVERTLQLIEHHGRTPQSGNS